MPNPTLPTTIDHLIYAAADLEAGRDAIEGLLGVRPILGGQHPTFGTHNALVSLGPTTYLEIIAPDPELIAPARGVLLGTDAARKPRLATWVLRSEAIDEAAAAATSAGVGLGPVEAGSRTQPDGTVLRWRLTDPYALPLGGAVPFLISWGDTPHPAEAAPRAGELAELRIEHSEPERVREALQALGAEIEVRKREAFRLVARIRTSQGDVELG